MRQIRETTDCATVFIRIIEKNRRAKMKKYQPQISEEILATDLHRWTRIGFDKKFF